MEPVYKNLGKVRPTIDNNNWSIDNKYDLLTIVYDPSSNKSYISRKDVPANIIIDNREYWIPFGVGKFVDNAIININYLDGVSQELITYTLKEAIARISDEDKRLGIIISFYGNEASDSHTPGWCLYQFMSDDLNDWDNINAWNSIYYNRNKNVGWFRTESELLAIYPFPHKGDYCYIGLSLISSIVYRCYENGTWVNTHELASINMGITIGGNIRISENGTWVVDDEDTGIKAVGIGIERMMYTPSQEDGGINILQVKLTDGTQFSFPIKNGNQGNSGIIVPDLETFLAELVNNLTTDDATKALSAAQGVVLDNKISQLGQEKVSIAKGKNLLDPNAITRNVYIISSDGTTVPLSGYAATDFIPVDGNNLYFNKAWIGGANGGGAVYNHNKQYLRAIPEESSHNYTYQDGDGYVRWSFNLTNLSNAQVEMGNSGTDFEPYNPIDNYLGNIKQDVGNIQTEIEEINNQINAKNSSTDFEKNITESESFQNIYPVDIKIGSYHLIYTNSISVSTGTYLRYYFEDNTYEQTGKIGASGDQTITFLKNVIAIRIMTVDFISGGTLDMHFEDLNKRLAIREQVDENTTDIKEIKDILNLELKDKFLRITGTLMQGGQKLSLGENNIANNKHLMFSCYFSIFGRIRVGHGYNMGTASWIEIDESNLYIYRSTSDAPVHTIAHGLTIQNNLQVSIDLGDDGYPLITIQSMGERFQFTHWTWYGTNGDIFAESVTGTYSNCVLSWTCNGYSADIHIYGDSYCGHLNDNRWPYYTMINGYNNYLLDAYGGKTSIAAYNTFLENINHSFPKYALWLMGMNDVDSESEVNTTWLEKVQLFIAKCEEQNIEPILATIPNVPNRIMTFKNNWVRNSGYRYIDFAKAVGAENGGSSWYEGMLSDDNIHPSELGAKTLYMELLVDFPEIMSYSKITTINTHINP